MGKGGFLLFFFLGVGGGEGVIHQLFGVVFDPVEVMRDSSVDAGDVGRGAAVAERDDAHLDPPVALVDQHRSAGIALFK